MSALRFTLEIIVSPVDTFDDIARKVMDSALEVKTIVGEPAEGVSMIVHDAYNHAIGGFHLRRVP